MLLLLTQSGWQVCPLCQAVKEGRDVMVRHLHWHPEVHQHLRDKDAPDEHVDYHCPEGCLAGLGLGRDQFILHKYKICLKRGAENFENFLNSVTVSQLEQWDWRQYLPSDEQVEEERGEGSSDEEQGHDGEKDGDKENGEEDQEDEEEEEGRQEEERGEEEKKDEENKEGEKDEEERKGDYDQETASEKRERGEKDNEEEEVEKNQQQRRRDHCATRER